MNKHRSTIKEENNDFYVNVLLKDKKYKIFCGEGKQKLRWLTDVVIHKYERYNNTTCGKVHFIMVRNGLWNEAGEWKFV